MCVYVCVGLRSRTELKRGFCVFFSTRVYGRDICGVLMGCRSERRGVRVCGSVYLCVCVCVMGILVGF